MPDQTPQCARHPVAASDRLRLDARLIEIGAARGRGEAQRLIGDGRVTVDGKVTLRPGQSVHQSAHIHVDQPPVQFASRGGLKLSAALDQFPIDIGGRVTLDAGASTGGFTDVLLKRGAARVYAVDVGYGQIAWSLRTDPRVVVMDRTNIRYLETLPETPSLATIDVAFISLDLVLPPVRRLLLGNGQAVCLVKPQFEAGKHMVGKGGVVRDPRAHAGVLRRVLANARLEGWRVAGLMTSPITGPAGNREFLAWLNQDPGCMEIDLENAIQRVIGDAPASST
jgi:23S rRNA (cytidine1920-2'-O)/16S rRNA (cytidine1409-2'-O)-methyltransferase